MTTPTDTPKNAKSSPQPIVGQGLAYYAYDFEPSPMLGEAMAEIEADGHGKAPRGGYVTRRELHDPELADAAADMAQSANGQPAGSKWYVKVAVTTPPPNCIIDPENEDWPWMAERFRVVHDRRTGEIEAEYRLTSL